MPYEFQPVMAPGADGGTWLGGINNAGQVVGYSMSTAVPVPQGFVDTAGAFTSIVLQPPFIHPRPAAINNSGTVVGADGDAVVGVGGFLWNPDGSSQPAPSHMPGSVDTIEATGNNDAGVIVGSVHGNAIVGRGGYDPRFPSGSSGFMLQNGTIAAVQAPGASSTGANDINNGGTIVGTADNHGFEDVGGRFTLIDVPGAINTEPMAINNGGTIVGSYSDGTHEHGFVDAAGQITTIDAPGAVNTWITGVNDGGTIDGYTSTTPGDIVQGFIATDRPPPPAAPTPVSAPVVLVLDTSTHTQVAATATPYTGPVAGLQNEYINATRDNINITASTPNWFIHTGSGMDAIAASSGVNVLDGGTGSNFLTGGSGTDTFFVDDRSAPADIWSTVVGFHAGDAATIWGVTPQDFSINWTDGQGAAGFTGLTLHATAPSAPTASLTLTGYTQADLSDGRLAVQFGTDAASGSSFMYVHGAS